MDISDTIEPKSDQLNYEDFVGGPVTVTVTEVNQGSAEQPVNIHVAEFNRPFKPSKTVRRIIVAAWGKETVNYTGRRMTLYGDPSVKWAGQAVGGIRVSALSHIDKRLSLTLQESKGKRKLYVVEPLPTDAPTTSAGNDLTAAKQRVWQAHKATQPDLADADRKVEVAQLIAEQGLDPNSAADMDKLVGVINGD